jgi:hypothetical protein
MGEGSFYSEEFMNLLRQTSSLVLLTSSSRLFALRVNCHPEPLNNIRLLMSWIEGVIVALRKILAKDLLEQGKK